LLEGGANVQGTGGFCPMWVALEKRRFDIIQLLVEFGFDPKTVDMFAVFHSWDPEIMEYFIDAGADIENEMPPKLEIADIVKEHGADFLSRYHASPMHRRVLKAIAVCRTKTLGGHVHHCRHCPHMDIAYNSCRNRHCPKCQGSVAAKWMLDREAELLNSLTSLMHSWPSSSSTILGYSEASSPSQFGNPLEAIDT